jgi:hypothetical protein
MPVRQRIAKPSSTEMSRDIVTAYQREKIDRSSMANIYISHVPARR